MESDSILIDPRKIISIIQHTLTDAVRAELKDVISPETCKRIHDTLAEERKERGVEIKDMRRDFEAWQEKIYNKFDRMNFFIIATLTSTLGGLLLAGVNYFTKRN